MDSRLRGNDERGTTMDSRLRGNDGRGTVLPDLQSGSIEYEDFKSVINYFRITNTHIQSCRIANSTGLSIFPAGADL